MINNLTKLIIKLNLLNYNIYLLNYLFTNKT